MNLRQLHLNLLVVFALLAASCGGADDIPGELAFVDDEVTITIWAWAGFGYENLIDEFEAMHPNVSVELRESGYDQHHEGLLAAIEAEGELPDIAAVDAVYLPEFWDVGTGLVDLSSYDAQDRSSLYLDWRWDQGVAPTGEIIGIPTDVGGLALAYRKDLFAQAGLPSEPEDVAAVLETWDDLIDLGMQYGSGGSDGAFLDSAASVFNTRFGQLPGGYVTTDGIANLAEGSPVEVAWAQSIDAINAGVTGSFRQFSPEWNTAMAEGGFAALAAPSWMRGYLAANAPDNAGDWGLVALPEIAGNWGGSQLVIPGRATNPDLAWELVEFLTSESAQFSVFTDFGNFPSTPANYTRPEIDGLTDAFFGDQVVGPIFAESVSQVPVKRLNPGMRLMNNQIVDRLLDYELGDVTEREAWDGIIDELQELDGSG